MLWFAGLQRGKVAFGNFYKVKYIKKKKSFIFFFHFKRKTAVIKTVFKTSFSSNQGNNAKRKSSLHTGRLFVYAQLG